MVRSRNWKSVGTSSACRLVSLLDCHTPHTYGSTMRNTCVATKPAPERPYSSYKYGNFAESASTWYGLESSNPFCVAHALACLVTVTDSFPIHRSTRDTGPASAGGGSNKQPTRRTEFDRVVSGAPARIAASQVRNRVRWTFSR